MQRSGNEREPDIQLRVPLKNRSAKPHPTIEALSALIEFPVNFGAVFIALGKQGNAAPGETRGQQ